MRFISLTTSFKRFICVSIIFFSFVVSAQAQTGPGGIGKTDGTSNLKLWLNSASGTNSFTNGAAISSWADQSGSGYNAAQINSTNQPTYVSNSVNGQPALNFDGSNDRMEVPSFPLFTTSSSPVSMFVVFKATNVSSQRFLITQPQTNCSNSFELGYHTGSSFSSNLGLHNGCGNATVSENAAEANTYTILTTKVLSSGTAPTNIIMNKNGTALSMVTNAGGWASAGSYGTSAVNLVIGTRGVGDGQHFGTIAEVISYNMTLNTAQTTLVENYLNAKYNISISNDKYAQSTSTTYNKEVSGIGKESDGNHTSASSKGLSMTNSSYLDDNGDYFMFGYDNTATNTTTADLAAGFTNRWTRDWFFDKTDTGTANGDVIITFDYSDMGIGGTPSGDYALIYRSTTTGNFATVGGSPSISGDQVSFTVNASLLADGYYTLATITSLNADLSALSISSGALSPIFVKGTIAYTANVNSSITSITVTPTQSDANATIEVQVNGSGYATVTTATASSALALSVGANTVDVKVTAADGSASKTYTITITVTNTPPTFTSTAVTSVNQGETYTYSITTNDIDGDAVSVTATTKPSWLTITSTGVVSTFAGSTSGFVNGPINTASFTSVVSAAIDASGNMYVADLNNNVIRKINSDGVVSTFAGSGSFSYADGTGTAASFNTLERIAVDLSGNVYVTDRNNHKIRKITPAGVVTTLAGSSRGSANGSGTAAQFSSPKGIAVDNSGNVYVADTNNHRIRKITPAGAVTTLAGSSYGDSDGTGTGAQFQSPQDVAVDGSGNVYVADTNNSKVKKITPAGVVTTLAGSTVGYLDGTGTAAMFAYPKGIEVDGAGNIYLADTNNYRIRKITPTGVVTTFAGRTITVIDPMMGGDYETGGFEDGNTADALFNRPNDITIDASGNLYVADNYNYKIRKITTTGAVLSGDTTGQVGDHNVVLDATDVSGGAVQQIFTISVKSAPTVIATAASAITASGATLNSNVTANGGATVTERGFVYAKTSNDATPTFAEVNGTTVIKEVVTGTTGAFTKALTGLIANTGFSYVSYAINSVGTTESSIETFTTINTPPTFTSTAITSVNEGDTYSYAITTNDVDGDAVSVTATTKPSWLTIHTNVEVSTLAGSDRGDSDGTGTSAQFSYPKGIAIDPSGNVYVADTDSHKIRKITPAGVVSTFAGSSYGFADGTGTAAQFQTPYGITADASGNVYVADTGNQKIRKITPAGVVSTFAGSSFGFADGTGTAAQFKNPYGVAVDASGNVYVADNSNHIIRKITPAGVVSTFAGSSYGFADGTATAAKFYNPRGVAVDASGNVYVADYGNRKIRKITPAGVVSTLAGSTAGDVDGTGTSVQFSSPGGITVDTSGNVYVADSGNHKIRKITPAGVVSTLAGSSTVVQDDMGMTYNEGGYIDGNGATAKFNSPYGVAVDTSGNLYVGDANNHKIRKITTSAVLSGDTTGQVGDHNVVLDGNDGNGATVQQPFTIHIVVPVLTKNGGISFTNPNYVNKNGAVNTSFGLSANGAVIVVKD